MAFTTLPTWIVERLRASRLTTVNTAITELRPLYVRKASDETVNNSSTLQDDNELLLTPSISHTYLLDGQIFYSTGTTPDLKLAFTFPTGAVLAWSLFGYKFDGSSFESEYRTSTWQAASGTSNAVAGTTATYDVVHVRGILRMSTTAGNLQLQWAQNTANASNTVVKADSWLRLTMVD